MENPLESKKKQKLVGHYYGTISLKIVIRFLNEKEESSKIC